MNAPSTNPRYKRDKLIGEPTRNWLPDFVARVISDLLEQPLDLVRTALSSLSAEQFKPISQAALRHVMSDNLRFAAEVCSRHGWFIDGGFPAPSSVRLAGMYEAGETTRADELFVEYYRDRLIKVRQTLLDVYPERARILGKAFSMHLEGEYDVSVPLFLIQADGICLAAFGREFFRVRKGALAAHKVLAEKDTDWIWQAMLEPFRGVPPLVAGTRRRRVFNRNRILHGASLDYGSEANSLRAISLLAFLHGLESYAKRERVSTASEDANRSLV
jgi:hypothetical protein